ncbi:hypothetical protein [uncultured Roseobacter sp.]|uniref:hypothetical protein n=1 Tax=uncultured Roseobacter sp. TaxID=114847 RepID=UPI00262E2506|nr:hypothetical protein [uncultured Roseobacter sp.]
MPERLARTVKRLSFVVGSLTVASILALFAFFIFIVLKQSFTNPNATIGTWSSSIGWEQLFQLIGFTVGFTIITLYLQLLVAKHLFLNGSFKGLLKFSLRFLAGLPVFIVLSVLLKVPSLPLLGFLGHDFLLPIFVALALVPTGLLVLTELIDENNSSVRGATSLGLPKEVIFWRVVLKEQRNLAVLALAISVVRMFAELAVLFNIRGSSIDFAQTGDVDLIYGTADLLAQSINAGDNVILIVVILGLSLLGKLAVVGAAALMR